MSAPVWFTTRRRVAWSFAIVGLGLYNWWVAVIFRPSLLRSPNELFSNLEASGQPFAGWMQHADLVSGLLLLAAFIIVGWRSLVGGAVEWVLLLLFAIGGAFGGLSPEQCLDTINRTCHTDEIELRLGSSQYLHIASGIVEFSAITAVLYLSYRRTRAETTIIPTFYPWLGVGAFIGYPLLAVAYLFVLGGSVIEGVFFIGISLVVIAQLRERTASRPREGDTAFVPLIAEEMTRSSTDR